MIACRKKCFARDVCLWCVPDFLSSNFLSMYAPDYIFLSYKSAKAPYHGRGHTIPPPPLPAPVTPLACSLGVGCFAPLRLFDTSVLFLLFSNVGKYTWGLQEESNSLHTATPTLLGYRLAAWKADWASVMSWVAQQNNTEDNMHWNIYNYWSLTLNIKHV